VNGQEGGCWDCSWLHPEQAIGTSKGWAKVMCWVEVGGGDRDRSSMREVGMGDREGLCCRREWVDMRKEG
jgi:hypothetical protein